MDGYVMDDYTEQLQGLCAELTPTILTILEDMADMFENTTVPTAYIRGAYDWNFKIPLKAETITVNISIEEQEEHEAEGEGINFTLEILAGRMALAQYIPYNFTPNCWVPLDYDKLLTRVNVLNNNEIKCDLQEIVRQKKREEQ